MPYSAFSLPISNNFEIEQSSHGFSKGDWLRFNSGSNNWVKADNTAQANAGVIGMVSSDIDTDTFELQLGGEITGLSSALTPGAQYYLDSTAGAMTSTRPSGGNYIRPIFVATSPDSGFIINQQTVGTMAIENIGAITTSILSDTDNTDDLGSASFQWANTYAVNCFVGTAIIHTGDTDTRIAFGANTQDFQTGGSSRLDLSDSGMRLGGANSRVTTILDEDNMVSDSATALSTQQAIKKYVDDNAGGGGLDEPLVTVNATSVSSVDFDNLIDSTADDYLIIITRLVPVNNNALAYLRAGTGSTPTYDNSNSYAWGALIDNIGGTGAANASTSDSQILLTATSQGINNSSPYIYSGHVYIHNAPSSALHKNTTGRSFYRAGGFAGWSQVRLDGTYFSTTAMTSAQILLSGGNISEIQVSFYKINKL